MWDGKDGLDLGEVMARSSRHNTATWLRAGETHIHELPVATVTNYHQPCGLK
jgi:hypothetical protein